MSRSCPTSPGEERKMRSLRGAALTACPSPNPGRGEKGALTPGPSPNPGRGGQGALTPGPSPNSGRGEPGCSLFIGSLGRSEGFDAARTDCAWGNYLPSLSEAPRLGLQR